MADVASRTYKKRLEAARGNMSAEQISAGKNQRTKGRNAARRAERAKVDADRKAASPAEQLGRLDSRLGKGIGAKRERLRLTEKAGA